MKNFEDLDIWKDAIQLAKDVFVLTQMNIFETNSVLRDQLRLISLSISNHIVEGFEFNNHHQFLKHLKLAKGYCGDIRSMMTLLVEISFIDTPTKDNFTKQSQLLSDKIAGLIKFLEQSKLHTQPTN